MSSIHIYNLGPVYCKSCNDTCLHRLTTDRPFFGVGPYSPYNIWMDAIKTSKVSCLKCGFDFKMTSDLKELFKKLKEANLVDMDDQDALEKRFVKLIEQNNVVGEYNDEKKKAIVDSIYNDYKEYGIPYKWFDDYFLIMFASCLRKKSINDYLYK